MNSRQVYQRTTGFTDKRPELIAPRHADCAVPSMENQQIKIDADDALGSAMRAFVDHSRAKGIGQEELTFVLISTAIGAALDRAPSYSDTLVTAMRAVTCAANIFADEALPRRVGTEKNDVS
jgi:hypothetical protein